MIVNSTGVRLPINEIWSKLIDLGRNNFVRNYRELTIHKLDCANHYEQSDVKLQHFCHILMKFFLLNCHKILALGWLSDANFAYSNFHSWLPNNYFHSIFNLQFEIILQKWIIHRLLKYFTESSQSLLKLMRSANCAVLNDVGLRSFRFYTCCCHSHSRKIRKECFFLKRKVLLRKCPSCRGRRER